MRSRAPVVLAVAAAAACGGQQRPRQHADEVRIRSIDVDGNRHVDSDTLLDGLALTRLREEGQEFDPYLVGQDADRLRGYYLRHGYFRARVTSKVDQQGTLVAVLYHIDEGPLAHLARVEVAGLPEDPHVTAEDIRKLIPLEDGESFDYEPYDLARPQLVAALEKAGYAYARVETKVAADVIRDEAIIHIDYTPGPLCHFGAVRMHGVSGELAEAAQARIEAKAGDRYSSDTLRDTQESLYAMQRFSQVRIEPDRSSGSAVVPVDVYLAEQPPHELRLGGGVGVNPAWFEVRGRAAYTIAGWPRPLVTTHLELKPAYVIMRDTSETEPRLEAIAALERLDLLVPKLVGELEVSYSYLAVEAYTSYGPRTRLGLRYPIYRRYVQGGVGWQVRYLDFDRIDPAVTPEEQAALGLHEPYLLGFYEQNLFVDLRDDPVEPRWGVYAEMRAEEGGKASASDFSYVKLTPELRGYVPLGYHFVLAARGRYGTILGDIPLTQRYFAGGASSQRGFPERQLAPTVNRVDMDGTLHQVVVGGGALVETGAELRCPLGTAWNLKFGGVLFLDGADVTESEGELDFMNLHWATGAGVRIATPIGPARIDVGYRLNRTGAGEPREGEHFAYHLSLGEAF